MQLPTSGIIPNYYCLDREFFIPYQYVISINVHKLSALVRVHET